MSEESVPGPNQDPGRSSSADWRRGMGEAGRYIGLGTQLALTMLLFVGGGFLLDRYFGVAPLLTIIGAVVGMASMFLFLIRLAREAGRKGRSEIDTEAR